MARPESGSPDDAAAILDALADMVLALETDGRITYVNRAAERIVGIPLDRILGHSFLEGIASEDHARTISLFRKVVETGEERTARFQVVRPDGLRIALEASLRPSTRRDGARSITAVCRDVTHHESANVLDQLRRSQYRSLVESGLAATAIATADGTIVYANRRFRALFDDAAHVDALVPAVRFGQRQALANAWFESTREEGTNAGHVEIERPGTNGTPRSSVWVALQWSGFQSEGGERLFALQAGERGSRKQLELAFTRLARGVDLEDAAAVDGLMAALARALGLDRLVLARCDPARVDQAEILAGWQEGERIEPGAIALDGLPEATASRGPLCIHPAGVPQLLPAVVDRFGIAFESFAGIGLVADSAGAALDAPIGAAGDDAIQGAAAAHPVLGVLAGYARRPLADPERVRELLSSAARPFAEALARAARRSDQAASPASCYATLLRHTQDFVLELDEAGRILARSPAVDALLAASPDARTSPKLGDLATAASTETCLTALTAPCPDGFAGHRVELALRPAAGIVRRLEAHLVPLDPGRAGRRRGLLIGLDACRSALPEVASELLHRVIEQSADLVFVCDLDTTILFANETVGRQLAIASTERLVGRSLLDLLTPTDAARLRGEILPHLAPGLPWRGERELAAGGPDGDGERTTPTEATVQLVRDRAPGDRRGVPRAHLAVTLRDIRARRRIEIALRESELSLAQARKMESVGRLAGGIAHDFNNLLTAIIGYSDLVLQELAGDHAARPDIEEILRAAERAGGLTRQLLAFSRRQVLRPERVDLNAVVADIDRMLRRLIGEDVELVTELDGGLDAILADPGQIEQVIVNLVVNARDAMPRGGRLEIETANFVCRSPQRVESGQLAPGSYVTLRVSDSGIGMDEQTRAQIFEPFFTTKSAAGGTGLGLASVYGIVSQSRGQIAVESRLGRGSTFTLYLPTANEELAEIEPEEALVAGRGRETVLLVEDSRPVLKLIERTLHRRGYTVLPAESATAALRQCSRHEGPIDLLLTDVVLPRMSGPEIAERVRQLRPGVRVLFMSGFTDETLAQHGLARDELRMLEKPFSSATLLARVRTALDQSDAGEAPDEAAFLVEHPLVDQGVEE
ncbi:MAG: PAS domain-containing protein [Myxococcota bacterium]